MHPAYSVILFTTASGAGYGLLILVAAFAIAGQLPPDPWLGTSLIGLATGLVSLGLISSTFHLGRPERAWRALSQWRTSWLSREGIAAALTFVPTALFFFGWVVLGRMSGFAAWSAVATAAMAVVTLVCTAMIYASLKPIRQWHNGFVLPVYLSLGLMTGSLLLLGIAGAFGLQVTAIASVSLGLVVIGWAIKRAYWRHIDVQRPSSTLETATGLRHMGPVRLLESPHTEENFLMQEMGYQVARKHARKMRDIAQAMLFVVPCVLLVVILLLPWTAAVLGALATLSAAVGVGVERWLFFAEARHTSMLYYGRAA